MSELDDMLLVIAKQLNYEGENVRVEFKDGQQAELVLLYLKEDPRRAKWAIAEIFLSDDGEALIEKIANDEMLEFSKDLMQLVNDDVIGEICTRVSLVAGQHLLDNTVKH